MEERLQKFLASAGVASRRKAEELILQGRVKVNEAQVTKLGTKVDPARDLVTVDGKLVSEPTSRAYYLLYKPPGCVTTASDPEGRPTAFEYLRGVPERVFPVGRLDWDAEGALLFTDDGELANRLAHPRYGHSRVYLVKVKGDPAPEALQRMVAGVRLEDGPARALEAQVHEQAEKNVWIRVVVAEGRFHLVKRLCEAVGLQVQRLFRPEFGGVSVEGLRSGAFRPLHPAEVRGLKQAVGLEAGTAAPIPRAMPKAARRHGHGPPAPPRERAPRDEDADREQTARSGPPRHEAARHGGPPRDEQARRGGPPTTEPARWSRAPRDEKRSGGPRRDEPRGRGGAPRDEARRRGPRRDELPRGGPPRDDRGRGGPPRREPDRRSGAPRSGPTPRGPQRPGAGPGRGGGRSRGPGRGR